MLRPSSAKTASRGAMEVMSSHASAARQRLVLRGLVTALLLSLAAGMLLGQSDDVPLFKADSRLVVLHASVVDKKGKLLTDLPQNAFKVYENGAEQDIKIFRREDVPVSMGMVIDNSGSMRDKRARVERASLDLVKASNPQDEVFIVNFNDEAYLDVEFTNDMHLLEQGIARIDSRGGPRCAIPSACPSTISNRRARRIRRCCW